MENVNKTITNWLNELEDFKYPTYEQLPDIELYMEQMMYFLERELAIFKTSSLDKVITPFMINNYVKGEVINKPVAKKYSKEHLSKINETCMLKSVLSISETKQILDKEYEDTNISDAYNSFKTLSENVYKEKSKEILDKMDSIEDNDTKSLTSLALNLATEASANIAIAKRMLYYIKKYEDMKIIKEELKKD